MKTIPSTPALFNSTSGILPAASPITLDDGERISGTVLQLPAHGQPFGTSLFLRTSTGVVSIPASPKKGSTVLSKQLDAQNITTGDRITIILHGWRQTVDGERRYRDYEVRVSS